MLFAFTLVSCLAYFPTMNLGICILLRNVGSFPMDYKVLCPRISNDFESMWKEAVAMKCKVLSRYVLGGTEKNHEITKNDLYPSRDSNEAYPECKSALRPESTSFSISRTTTCSYTTRSITLNIFTTGITEFLDFVHGLTF